MKVRSTKSSRESRSSALRMSNEFASCFFDFERLSLVPDFTEIISNCGLGLPNFNVTVSCDFGEHDGVVPGQCAGRHACPLGKIPSDRGQGSTPCWSVSCKRNELYQQTRQGASVPHRCRIQQRAEGPIPAPPCKQCSKSELAIHWVLSGSRLRASYYPPVLPETRSFYLQRNRPIHSAAVAAPRRAPRFSQTRSLVSGCGREVGRDEES